MRLPQPGETVGPYTCLRLLASGGMGAVYEARHPELPRSVALKLLLAPEDPELVARFHREAEACGRLNHPNLVRVHDSGSVGGACYLAMELIGGESLQAVLERSGPVAPEQAKAWIGQAAAGIAHAHEAGVLHRDLKPSNILWERESGRVCVVDFGLTGRLSADDSLTVTGEVLGTPGYLAPEQVGAFGGRTDPRTDVYGLGATLFALLTGRRPFLGAGLAGLAEVAEEPAPDVRSLQPEVEPVLAALVARCLAKDPGERFAQVSELQAVLDGRAGVGPAPRRRRGRGAMLWAGALASACLLGWADLSFQGAQAGPRSAEAYATWRASAGEAFAYGWGELEPDYAEALQSWSERLERSPAPAHEPWSRARRDVRAQLRLIAAAGGADSGFPDEGAGPEDYLAQAVIDLRAGRFSEAATALESVRGPLATTRAAARTRFALEARLEPRRFLSSSPEGSEVAREAARAEFGPALERVAPEASQEEILRWYGRAAKRAWPEAPQALRAAIEASLERRKRELVGAPLAERGRLLRTLCRPLRAAGLYPGGGFQAACRELLAEEVRAHADVEHGPARAERAASLIRFEHEVFYGVDPSPSWLEDYPGLLHEPGPEHRDAILERALYRYGLHPKGFGIGESRQALEAIAGSSEPGSQLERGLAWLGRDSSQVSRQACVQAQAELLDLLNSGVRDAHPRLVQLLIEHVRGLFAALAEPMVVGDAEALATLAEREFRASLPWVRHHWRANSGVILGHFASATAWPYFYLGRPFLPQGLEGFTKHLAALEALESGAKREQVKEGFGHGIEIHYGGLANFARAHEFLPQVEDLLERGRARMAESEFPYEFARYWAAVVELERRRDPSQALKLVDSLSLDEKHLDPYLAISVGRVLTGTPEAKRALPGLRHGLGWLKQYGSQVPEAAELRGDLNALLESCAR